MKKIILPISFVILLFAFGGIGSTVTSSNLGRETFQRFLKGEIPAKEAHINFIHYQNPFWNEELDIEDGVIRFHKSVHNSVYFDGMRARIKERGYSAPYEDELLQVEEGDYDKYYMTKFDPKMLVPFVNSLDENKFYDMKKRYGDKEIWRIEIEIDGASKVVSVVVIDNTPGFQKILDALHPILDDVREHEVDADEFESPGMN